MNGIWSYKKLLNLKIDDSNCISIEEGHTPIMPLVKLASELGVDSLYLKREDLNPNGSFKDRSLAYQISYYKQKGVKELVISSSGNSAISAVAYCKLAMIRLNVFISPLINNDKLNRLIDVLKADNKCTSQLIDRKDLNYDYLNVVFSRRAKSDAIKYANERNLINITGSKDDLAVEGYKTIAPELIRRCFGFDAIFIPCSSGTSTMGIYQGYKMLKASTPRFFIVQTTKVNTIARVFDQNFEKTETSLCSAIVDKVAVRKEKIISIINDTRGSGIVVDDDLLIMAKELLKNHEGINISYDGAVGLAGLIKLLKKDKTIKNPVVLISGK